MRLTAAAFCAALLAASALAPAVAQPPPVPRPGMGDHVVLADRTSLFEAPLPRGPAAVSAALPQISDAMTFSPDGRLLAVREVVPPDEGPVLAELFEIGEDGQPAPIGSFDLEGEHPMDLAATADGRLYLLSYWFWWNPPETRVSLLELDPAAGKVLSRRQLPWDVVALAPARGGLWALTWDGLARLDPATGALWDTGFAAVPDGRTVQRADTDSAGALWILTTISFISPPVQELWRLDPLTGSLHAARFPIPRDAWALAIRRQCQESSTARCLQGGRFRAEVDWRDFESHTGPGRVAPSGSADSALFWFFERSNWELLLKVLDGCDHNGHFWVFSAATTDVAYTLRVTDLETGTIRAFDNALGQAAPAVTETLAFPCGGG